MEKKYFFPNDEFYYEFFGDQSAVCVDEAETERLGREWFGAESEKIWEMLHEASEKEIRENGIYKG